MKFPDGCRQFRPGEFGKNPLDFFPGTAFLQKHYNARPKP